MNIILKLKKAKLVGRGGACFPTYSKWDLVNKAKSDTKYIICNASEGEPGVKKDGFLFQKAPERVIDGIKIAVDFLNAEKAIIYINHKYYDKYRKKLIRIIKDAPIEIFKKPIESGYIGGEETSAINTIEGRRTEPRLRPPFPPEYGLFGKPTLVNNVETFYAVSLINSGEYNNKRLYTIQGDCLWHGVFEYPENWTILKLLKESKNFPKFDFFVQVGGDASGEIFNQRQLKRPVTGSGSIRIYSLEKHNKPMQLIKHWLNFFLDHSCGQCTPCREGVYRLEEIIKSPKPDWQLFSELLYNLEEASFCGLGCVVPIPIKSYIENVLSKMPESKINLSKGSKKVICECFK